MHMSECIYTHMGEKNIYIYEEKCTETWEVYLLKKKVFLQCLEGQQNNSARVTPEHGKHCSQ